MQRCKYVTQFLFYGNDLYSIGLRKGCLLCVGRQRKPLDQFDPTALIHQMFFSLDQFGPYYSGENVDSVLDYQTKQGNENPLTIPFTFITVNQTC